MAPSFPLRERAAGRWLGLLPSLGVSGAFLNGKHGPCPICKEGKDRFRFDNKDGNGTWICSKCGAGDGASLVMQVRGWDFKTAAEEIEKIVGAVHLEQRKPDRSEEDKRRAMNELWRSGRAITMNDAAGRYLRRRVGLVEFPESLRFVPFLRHPSGSPWFGMLAKVCAPDGSGSILHRTFLTEDGQKAPVEPPRALMPGLVAKGAAVRLATPGPSLGIAEGIETALAASRLHEVPVWAALNASLLAAWEPPAEAARVVIFADNDANFAGQAAAYALAKRIFSSTRAVEVRFPDEINSDWNDELNRRHGDQQ